MRRRPRVLFPLLVLLLAVLWQSVAIVRAGAPVDVLGDPAHAALHLQQKSHHHHHDGTFHLDDSEESVRHVLSDNANATAAPPVSAPRDLPAQATGSPAGWHDALPPSPYLEGPLRPPRRRA